ncbi:MAG: sulfite exporter TauE/SafE family protein [Microbacteriaceae bacterium]
MRVERARRPRAHWLWFVAIGLVAGFMSGLFGVGGGILIVPLLVLLTGFDQRLAAGTSLAAIVPTSLVGTLTYGLNGDVNWVAGLLLAAGAVGGAQLGTFLLSRLPMRAIQWAFIVFLFVVIVSLFVVIPSRDASLQLTAVSIAGFVALGFIVGVLSGILGIGGGVVVVPALILVFGASDLIAKGTSLLMMVPTAISGTVGNVRRRNVELAAAAAIGVSACTTVTLGALVANIVSPLFANILFACFLVAIAVQLIVKALRTRRAS